MEAYQRSEYIETDTRFVVIQVYFKYEQNANYTGIGQEVYEVKGPHTLFLRSIDSSLFQPDLLSNPGSEASYVIYNIALFCVILGTLFFLILNVSPHHTIRLYMFANYLKLMPLETIYTVVLDYVLRFGLFSTKQW